MCCARHSQPEVGGGAAGRWGGQRGLVAQVDPGQGEERCLLQCFLAYALFFPQYQGL